MTRWEKGEKIGFVAKFSLRLEKYEFFRRSNFELALGPKWLIQKENF